MKKIALILLFLNSLAGAESACDFGAKRITVKAKKPFVIKVQNTCHYWEKEKLTMLVKQFINEDTSKYQSLTILSLFDEENNKILSKNIVSNKKLLSVKDISIHPFHRFSITFHVAKETDAYGGQVELFLYEFKEKKLHQLLSNFRIKSWEAEADYESFESSFTYELKKESLQNKGYSSLVFNKKYQFIYSNEYDYKHPIHQEWNVNLDPIELLYDENKKEYNQIKEKPLFDLKQIEVNTKKGWRYKEVVLRAMLHNVPISVKNIESYQEIAKNLQDAKHKKEAKLLKKIIKESGISKEDFTKGFSIRHYEKKDIISLLKNSKGDFKPKNILPWKSKTILDVNEDTLIKAVCHVENDDIEFVFLYTIKK